VRRDTAALEPELITDPQQKAEAEALNGLRQYDFAVKWVYQALDRQPFKLRPSLIYSFQREALQGISAYAGITRPASVEILGSKHAPLAHISSKNSSKTSATTLMITGKARPLSI
jgi:hypothetical protein